ncbi:hypothetical protein ACVITL_003566 [Rhizobium pisi]
MTFFESMLKLVVRSTARQALPQPRHRKTPQIAAMRTR